MSGLAKCMTITDSWWQEGQRNVLFRPGFVVVLVVATKDQINKQMDKHTDRPKTVRHIAAEETRDSLMDSLSTRSRFIFYYGI